MTGAEISPFFEPLGYGCELISEDQYICNYDPWDTGLPERANGCGGIYYKRFYITPSGLVGHDRTDCKCKRDYYEQCIKPHELQKRNQAVRERLNADIQMIFGQINMLTDDRYNRMHLTTYQPQNPSQQTAYQYVKSYNEPREKVCFAGNPGRGKTHLAMALIRQVKSRGYTVLALKSMDLLNRIRKTYSKAEEEEYRVMNILKSVEMLLIDDIGVEKPNDWVKEKLYDVIDYRDGRKTTVFTTNLSQNEIAKSLTMALASRIYGNGKLLQIEGADRRIWGA